MKDILSEYKSKQPFFSIIIPVYNSVDVIDGAVKSIFDGSFKDFEIILIDDASADGSYMHCKKTYKEKNVHIYHNEVNKGVSYNRNVGINKSKGQYILFLDSDDRLEPDALSVIYEKLVNNPTDVLYSCAFYRGESVDTKYASGYGMKVSEGWLTDDLEERMNMFIQTKFILSIWTKVYKGSFLKDNRIQFVEEMKYAEDMLFSIECFLMAKKIYLTDYNFYFYRTNNKSVTHNITVDEALKNLMLYPLELRKFFTTNSKIRLSDEWKLRIINYFLSHNIEFLFYRSGYFSKPIWENDIKSSFSKEYAFLNTAKDEYLGEYRDVIRFMLSEILRYHKVEEMSKCNRSGECFKFPFYLFKKNDKVLIYGAGEVGRQFYRQAIEIGYINVVDIVDKNIDAVNVDIKVSHISKIKTLIYDYILIAVRDKKIAKEIKEQLINEGIPSCRIKWGGDTYEEKAFYRKHYLPMLDIFYKKFIDDSVKNIRKYSVPLKQLKGLSYIDCQKVNDMITAIDDMYMGRRIYENVIISLTSYPRRINSLKYTIFSLLTQTIQPNAIILWLSEEEFPKKEENLPKYILEWKKYGLQVNWTKDNIRSYKKLIPAIETYKDFIIVTADDDLYYANDWLETLYDDHCKYPDFVIVHRARRICVTEKGDIIPYSRWNIVNSNSASKNNFINSGSGALFPPNVFYKDICRKDLFLKVAPDGDDIWFWAMTVLNNKKIKVPDNHISELVYVDINEELSGDTLWSKNKYNNDKQIAAVIDMYPALKKIITE